jgi:hypothetical protein
LRGYVVAVGLGAALLCGCFGAALHQDRFARSAIAIAHETPVHEVPYEESKIPFTLHDGAEMQILDQKDEWLQVSTDPRRTGWLRRDQVLLLPRI